MKKIRISELRQRVTVFARTETGRDSEDYPTYADTDLFTTWAKVETDGTEETDVQKATFDGTRMVFTIRFRHLPYLDNTLCIRHDGLDYEIVGVDPCEFGHIYLRIHAKRTVVQ